MLAGDAPHYRTEKRYIHADGHVVPVDLSSTVVRDGDGEPVHLLTQVQDITERKRFEGQLQYLADHDSLTGLFNRRRFEEELTRELASAERYESRVAVLAIDLDDFKYINDSLGHSVGDELIARVGEALRARLRRTRRAGPPRRRRVRRDPAAHRRARPRSKVADDLLEAVGEVDLVGLGGRGGGKVSAQRRRGHVRRSLAPDGRGAAGGGGHRDVRRQGGGPRRGLSSTTRPRTARSACSRA